MNDFILTNESGLTLTVTQKPVEDYIPIMGGLNSNPTWEEYMEVIMDEYKPHFELIKTAIHDLGWIGETGENISNYWCFVFSDGTKWGFSWRAWGDLMQAIVGKREGYMTYYM